MKRIERASWVVPFLQTAGILAAGVTALHAAESGAPTVTRTYSNPAYSDPAVAAAQKLPDGSLSPLAYIATTVAVPAAYETVYLSGVLPEIPTPPAAPGDAEAQAQNVFRKIGSILRAQGLSEADVVSMTIYMWAPEGQGMDFSGMMRAYARVYGTPEQPNRPARTTVQVARLGVPGALLEVAVTAVRKPKS